jgi:hypothetical protein
METITQPGGIRNGVMIMPNNQADLRTVTSLLERIPSLRGGSADIPGAWSSESTALIVEVTAAIVTFQTAIEGRRSTGSSTPGAVRSST